MLNLALMPDVESGCEGLESVTILGFDMLTTDPQITCYSLHSGICVFDRDGDDGINK
jgi:hypothetical protein